MKLLLKKLHCVRYVLEIRNSIKKKINRKKAHMHIKRVISNKKNGDSKIRVGFIVQLPAVWDKQSMIYEAAIERGMEAFLFVVPNGDDNTYEDNYFVKEYPNAIKICKGDNVDDLRKYELDYLFYPRPYDSYLPESIRSTNMAKYVRCCYIPYGFTASDAFDEENIYNDFFDNINICFMDSEYMKGKMKEKYRKENQKGLKLIEYLGYPCLEIYRSMGETNKVDTITWTPRWNYDERAGGSNFLEYKDIFLNICKSSEKKYIFRPHPLMFDELVKKEFISAKEAKEYLDELRRINVEIDLFSPIEKILERTDVLISDFSTIVGAFFMTGRPIIYCNKGIKLNPIYQEMSDFIYMVNNANEFVDEINKVVVEMQDEKHDKRVAYIDNVYKSNENATEKILDFLCEKIA